MSASDSLNDQTQPSFTPSSNRSAADDAHLTLNRHVDNIFQSASRLSSQPGSPFPAHDSYFEEAIQAYQPSPSPPRSLCEPPASFLDHILNPDDITDTYLPFGYRRSRISPARRSRPISPSLGFISTFEPDLMPPTRSRASRLPNGYVDLTSETDDVPQQRQSLKRHEPTAGLSSKRIKRNDGTATKQETQTPEADIEEIDLSDQKVPLQEILQKQRVEAVKSQQKPEEKATTLTNFTCVICMDNPTDITATSCGHLFCHTCLNEALIAGENRSGPGEPKRSQCPVCRKFINRTKPTDIIPLLIKKGLATQPRKISAASTPKVLS